MRASTLAIGILASFILTATVASSCATASSDDSDGDGGGDGEDGETEETEEENNCTASQFECGSGECIAKLYACDGTPQCEDASDEAPTNTECPAHNCPGGQYACTMTECVSLSYYCDGFAECSNGQDEAVGCETTCGVGGSLPTTCEQACNIAYDCGALTCGTKLCAAFTGDPTQKIQVVSECMTFCQTQSVIELVTPASCSDTVYYVTSYDFNFQLSCGGETSGVGGGEGF